MVPDVLVRQHGRESRCDGGLLRIGRAALRSEQAHLFLLKTIRGRHCRLLEPVIKGFLGPAEGRPRTERFIRSLLSGRGSSVMYMDVEFQSVILTRDTYPEGLIAPDSAL